MTHQVLFESSVDSASSVYHIGGRPRGHLHAGPTGGKLGVIVWVNCLPTGGQDPGGPYGHIFFHISDPVAGLLNLSSVKCNSFCRRGVIG